MPAENLPQDYLTNHDCPHVPVSYNLIVKGNPPAVRRAVDSVYGALFTEGCDDECVIVDTGSSEEDFAAISAMGDEFPNLRVLDRRDMSVDYGPLCEEYLDSSLYAEFQEHGSGTGILSFAQARNEALRHSKNDVVFWIDSDDILAEKTPGTLRKGINRIFSDTPISQVFMDYLYEFGEDGTCTTVLRRERFFLRDRFIWKGNCHETACPVDPGNPGEMGYFEMLGAEIRHTEDRKPHRISDIRNYLILRRELSESENPDPRTVFYLGNSARGLKRFREALSYYDYFDFRSGSPDDRFAAHYYRGGIFMDPAVKRPFDALDAYLECLKIKPFDPRGFFGVARAYGALQRYRESVLWYNMGLQQNIPRDQIFSHDPTHIHYHPHVIAAYCLKELGAHEEAYQAALKAYKFRPDLPASRELVRNFYGALQGGRLSQAVQEVQKNITNPGTPNARRVGAQICEELQGVPPELEKRGISAVEPPDPREPRPNISFYCPSAEPWGPMSRLSGTGGSEKMVIILSEALQRRGVNVSVYCDIPQPYRGVHSSGVNWRHTSEFDPHAPRDVVVFWRCPEGVVHVPTVAQQRVIWNHDVQDPERYTPEIISLADFVQCQSEFHAEPLRDVIPPEKRWVARNAIEPLPPEAADHPRNPKRVLYCSSPDRGLLTATRVFARAKQIDPELQFVVTYGVTPWARKAFATQNHRFVPDLGRDVSMDVYERVCHRALDACDAIVLNRVGFAEMAGLMVGSGVWLYPTRFPEISCMNAMEAQAAGMVTLSTRFGALRETLSPKSFPALPELPEGDVPEEWIEEAAQLLVKAAAVPEHATMRRISMDEARRFDVGSLADEWIQKLGLGSEESSAASPRTQVPSVQEAESFKGAQ